MTTHLIRLKPGRATGARSANSQQQEFAMLIGAFETITRPPEESRQFADLLARFQEMAEASHLARESDLSIEEARDLIERFQSLWQPYLEENADAPPSINIWAGGRPRSR